MTVPCYGWSHARARRAAHSLGVTLAQERGIDTTQVRMLMEVDLGKVVGTATATVALIIASSIFLSNVNTKYTTLAARLGQLTDELRQGKPNGPRRENVREQVFMTERRSQLVRIASALIHAAVLTFIVTVLSASLSTAYPRLVIAKLVGGISLALGLIFLFAAVAYEMRESLMGREAIRREIADIAGS